MDEAIAQAVDTLRAEHRLAVTVDDRTLRLEEPVKGDVGNAVLRVLGVAEEASPVGAAARGPVGVAAGVWCNPELYLARWTKGTLWVVGYRLTGGARPNDYVRIEGRIPTRMEKGQWYTTVPDAVAEAFFGVGLLLDDPPFPVPRPPAPSRPPARPAPARQPRAPRTAPPQGDAARTPKPKPAPPAPPAPTHKPRSDAGRVCPECRLYKGPTQFVAGSEICVDCR